MSLTVFNVTARTVCTVQYECSPTYSDSLGHWSLWYCLQQCFLLQR